MQVARVLKLCWLVLHSNKVGVGDIMSVLRQSTVSDSIGFISED